jgi:hypothetical protein
MLFIAQMPPQLPDLPTGPDLQNMRGPVEIPAYTTWQVALLAVIAVGVFLLITRLIYRYINAKKVKPLETPYQVFQETLESAKNFDPADARLPNTLSKALRSYLLAVSESNTLGASSKELVAIAAKHPVIKSTDLGEIDHMLRLLDQARFQAAPLASKVVIDELAQIVESIETRIKKLQATREEELAQ